MAKVFGAGVKEVIVLGLEEGAHSGIVRVGWRNENGVGKGKGVVWR